MSTSPQCRAMLVAAGFGTRLVPLTHELPKPAVPVGNRPVAWYGMDHLARAGFRELIVNTHHLASRLEEALVANAPSAVQLTFVREPDILGTGGGVRNAWQPRSDEDLVTWNAKILYAPDLARALAHHREHGAIATMVVRTLPAGTTFAPVLVDGDGRVRGIRAVLPGAGSGLVPRMFTGIQILHARAHADLPPEGDIIEHAYQHWLARGENVASVLDDSPWFDVGVSARHYLEANLALARGELGWPGIEPDAARNLIAAGARLDPDSDLAECVVGAGACIDAGVRLRRSVVWPGAHVTSSADDIIVTPQVPRLAPYLRRDD